jgi:cleavage and polyadenylation specificity factor subunit 3
MIRFLPLGGAGEIGASCFYLNISGTGILLDCGIHPRKNGIESLPNLDGLKNLPLDFCFISHAHQDHIGSLPFLVQKYPHVIIYSTEQTREIAEITLHNTVNILSQNDSAASDFKIYTHEEIDFLVRFMRECEYQKEISITGMRHSSIEPIKITFYDAGHILGSASILIEHGGKRILYSGDINLSDQSIMIGADLKNLSDVDVLILETTYGSTDSSKLGTWNSEQIRFVKEANKIINNGGSVLIPVFALGKTQEMLSVVSNLMKKGRLTETNIYTGGVSKNISKIYDRNRYLVRRSDPNFEICNIEQIDLLGIEDMNEFRKNPGIVLAASGMMIEGTTSFKLANYWLKQENFAIFGVGYMDPDTPGFRIMNFKRGDKIQLGEFSEPQKINCAVERFYFPSHARREDLIRVVDKTNPGKIILVHGEYDSQSWIGGEILKKNPDTKVCSAEMNKTISIL